MYCYKSDGKLTNEHIVPYSLGGNLVLPKSSCPKCQEETKFFTDRVARSIYYPIRVRMKVQSRTDPKEKPRAFSVWGLTPTGFNREIRIPADLFPRTYHVPVLALPAALTGIVVADFFKAIRREVRSDVDNLYRLGLIGKTEFFMVKEKFFTVEFFRLLAQIGHAYMFSILRGEGAIPLLEDMILAGRPYPTINNSEANLIVKGDFHNFIGGVIPDEEINEMLKIDIVKGFDSYMVRVRFRMPIEQGWDFPTYQILCGWIPHQGRFKVVEEILRITDSNT